jgi:hypothetical protein
MARTNASIKTSPKTIKKSKPAKRETARTNTTLKSSDAKKENPGRSALERDFDRGTADLDQCLKNGPNGPPVFDRLGYELDYHKILKSRKPRSKASRGTAKYFKMLEDGTRDRKRKCEIMGTPNEKVSALTLSAWTYRASIELGKPYHKVEMEDFEELARRGFKGKEGEFEAENISEEDREKLMDISLGSAFRK